MKKKAITILCCDNIKNTQYYKFLSDFFDIKTIVYNKESQKKDDVDLLLFTGGEDVDPSHYDENKGKYTFSNINRDQLEISLYNKYIYLPKLGICRGAQFLTVMSGGKLIQHVEGHDLGHHYIDSNNELLLNYMSSKSGLYVTSTHHQMMYPYNLDKNSYQLIGWSKKFLSNIYLNGNDENIELPDYFLEPEIIYYKRHKALAIQGHPEYNNATMEFKLACISLINYLLLK